MSKYSIELTNGRKVGLEVRVEGLDNRVRFRTAQFQEIINHVMFQTPIRERKVKDWEMVDTLEEWEDIETKTIITTIPALPAKVRAKLK